jgi:hypothetical protein
VVVTFHRDARGPRPRGACVGLGAPARCTSRPAARARIAYVRAACVVCFKPYPTVRLCFNLVPACKKAFVVGPLATMPPPPHPFASRWTEDRPQLPHSCLNCRSVPLSETTESRGTLSESRIGVAGESDGRATATAEPRATVVAAAPGTAPGAPAAPPAPAARARARRPGTRSRAHTVPGDSRGVTIAYAFHSIQYLSYTHRISRRQPA